MNKILPLLFGLLCSHAALAQQNKPMPVFSNEPASTTPTLRMPAKPAVPPAANPFNAPTTTPKTLPALMPHAAPANAAIHVVLGENGLPIMMEGKTAASGSAADARPAADRALDYLASIAPQGLEAPAAEFVVKSVHADAQGNQHIRMEQYFQGVPVWGGELIAHTENGVLARINGRYFPTPELKDVTPALASEQALDKIKQTIGLDKIKTNWTETDLKLIDGAPFSAQLVVFHPNDALRGERLAWHVVAHPNILSRMVYFLDANTGEVLNSYDNTCNLVGHHHLPAGHTHELVEPEVPGHETMVDGPVNIQGQDLFNVNRSFTNGGWQAGSVFYMEDVSKSMFNPNTSSMPGDPVGVLVTLDGLNTSPQTNGFDYDFVKSNTATFTNKKGAISAHYNAGLSFDYFKSKHQRNSIDGVGGNIISFVNITEDDGASMENAFWNGAAMWYGNGGSTFRPLARGLDVGGHEMTHGVVEKTANLVYQGESGALNESFADVFGAMIDSDDWKIGEDVMQSGGGLPTALRDLANPHNGFSSGSPWWQPSHMNEKYTGTQDNGGVHINSGIPNHAFYLFASNAAVGKDKAEQVYYKALRDYLTKNSKFVDCRIAVIQAATDLYGTNVANIAANAFAAVGIGGSVPSGNYLGQLSPNPGTDYVLAVTNNLQNLDLFTGTGAFVKTLYNQGVNSRPSVTDNGKEIVFVNNEGHIIYLGLDYSTNPIDVIPLTLSDFAEWRQVAISKDGYLLAALTTTKEPAVHIFDFSGANSEQEKYTLYNPTYTDGQVTGDVQFADVLEFDYSGNNLMYDSYNELSNNQGETFGYWDIGFLEFYKNGQLVLPQQIFISKLFSGIPDNTSIGNPAFAKNSPFVIAFDFIDNTTGTVRNDIYGANNETGDYNILVSNNGTLGWPNYNRLDNKLIFETQPTTNIYNLRLQGLAANKIQPSGNTTAFVSNHSWGVWYGNGTRSLLVDANEPGNNPLQVQVSPNPVYDAAQIRFSATTATAAQVGVYNSMGQLLLQRQFEVVAGDNQLDFDMGALPSGVYVLKIAAGNAVSALQVVKL